MRRRGTDCQPLSIISSSGGEQGVQGVVGWDDESNSIDKEFGGNVEKDQEEVRGSKAKNNVDLLNASLFLKVIESAVLAKLYREHG